LAAAAPGADATDRTEALRQKIPINLRREPDQRVAKVDNRLQRRPKKIVLTIVARLAQGFPPTANPPSKESQNTKIRNPKMQENRVPAPAFLQNLILVRIKSQRSINHFRILHGQLSNFGNAKSGYSIV
jgi:hypothetical protein